MIAEYAGTTNKAGLSMGVFFSFCFISFYGGGIDVVGYVYCCEYFSIPSRSVCFRGRTAPMAHRAFSGRAADERKDKSECVTLN